MASISVNMEKSEDLAKARKRQAKLNSEITHTFPQSSAAVRPLPQGCSEEADTPFGSPPPPPLSWASLWSASRKLWTPLSIASCAARCWRSPRARLAGTSSAPAACCPGRRGGAGARCSASLWSRASCTGCCRCATWSSSCECSATTVRGAAATPCGCGSWRRTSRAAPSALPAAAAATAQAAAEAAGRKSTGRLRRAQVGTSVKGHRGPAVGLGQPPAGG